VGPVFALGTAVAPGGWVVTKFSEIPEDAKELAVTIRGVRAVEAMADLVGSARQSLADPDWFLKARLGRAFFLLPKEIP